MPNGRSSILRAAAIDLGVALLSATLLALTIAPFGQFYLAWIGLVPLLWRIQLIRRTRRAAALGFVAGIFFFAIGFHWLYGATHGGYVVVCLMMSCYWMLAAALVHRIRHFGPVAHALATAAIWTGTEQLRCTVLGGFPWLQFGHSQSPVLLMCQIADVTGVAGVTAWLVLLNAAALRLWLDRKRALSAGALAAIATVLLCGYGFLRETRKPPTTSNGPTIALVQSNHIHRADGEKPVTQQEEIDYLLAHSANIDARIIAWPETTMPPFNIEARTEPGLGASAFFDKTLAQVGNIASDRKASIVTGGYYVGGFQGELGRRRATDIRNSVYVISPDRELAGRYDKIRLVPFAEYLPFQETESFLHRIMTRFATASYASGYRLTPAAERTVFSIDGIRVVTPICFEDTLAPLTRSFFAPEPVTSAKRADLILNISNDGWFDAIEKAQHLQIAIFRSIENRVPTARVSNTGPSAFIDSSGRVEQSLAPFTEGVLVGSIQMDARLSLYTRFGDVFAWGCVVGLAAVGAWSLFGGPNRGNREFKSI